MHSNRCTVSRISWKCICVELRGSNRVRTSSIDNWPTTALTSGPVFALDSRLVGRPSVLLLVGLLILRLGWASDGPACDVVSTTTTTPTWNCVMIARAAANDDQQDSSHCDNTRQSDTSCRCRRQILLYSSAVNERIYTARRRCVLRKPLSSCMGANTCRVNWSDDGAL